MLARPAKSPASRQSNHPITTFGGNRCVTVELVNRLGFPESVLARSSDHFTEEAGIRGTEKCFRARKKPEALPVLVLPSVNAWLGEFGGGVFLGFLKKTAGVSG